MKVLIDNGHGVNTKGKRSPDGRLREYAYTREIADRVVNDLKASGLDAIRIVPEETDIPLEERVARANNYYAESGNQAILVSIHCNAMGNGKKWMDARGWSVFVGPNASAESKQIESKQIESKRLATALANVAQSKGVTVRKEAVNRNYWVANFCICRDTLCPAVLVENFFMDNENDVNFLLSEKGKQCVTDIIVEGIKKYLTGK